MEIRKYDLPTDGHTWVGARDACASKNDYDFDFSVHLSPYCVSSYTVEISHYFLFINICLLSFFIVILFIYC